MFDDAPRKDADYPVSATPPSVLAERLRQFEKAAGGAYSRHTERALRADIERFTDWCARESRCALPARADTVVDFIDAMSRTLAPGTVRRLVSSLCTVHRAAGIQSPLEHTAVQLALKRMHRRKGRRQKQVQGLTWALRERLIGAAGDRLIDRRNCAMVALAYDTLVRRSELVALQVTDLLVETGGTASVLLRRSKTDASGEGKLVYLHRDSLKLVQAWVRAARLCHGALFRSVAKDGGLGQTLDPSQVPRIYRRMGRVAGLPDEIVRGLSGHSPRVGAVQDMIASGIGMPAILQAGRWKSTAMVYRYGEQLLAQRSGAAQLARLQDRR